MAQVAFGQVVGQGGFHDGRTEALFNSDREGFYAHVRRGVQLALGLVRSTMLHDVWPAGLPSQTASGIDATHRLESLMDWMLGQKDKLATISIHDLLTHVVDETAISCQEIGEEIRKGGRPEPELKTETTEE